MHIDRNSLRTIAEGCVFRAYRRWQDKRIRITNHRIDDGLFEREWLTVFRADGSVRIVQHFPTTTDFGVWGPKRCGGWSRHVRRGGVTADNHQRAGNPALSPPRRSAIYSCS
jgi:hypothetical protein